jgi:lauroyl/myristoyl acyltransferase
VTFRERLLLLRAEPQVLVVPGHQLQLLEDIDNRQRDVEGYAHCDDLRRNPAILALARSGLVDMLSRWMPAAGRNHCCMAVTKKGRIAMEGAL